VSIRRRWDFQILPHSWPLQLGFHIDHTDPSVTVHLPWLIVAAGRLKQPGFRDQILAERDALRRQLDEVQALADEWAELGAHNAAYRVATYELLCILTRPGGHDESGQ
jgi:hypothetical protein